MKVIYIALKDLLRSFRSMFAIGMMFVIPMVLTGLIYFGFGSGFSGGQQKIADVNVLVVNQDKGAPPAPNMGDLLVTFLQDERMPDWLVVKVVQSEAEARKAIENQQASVAVLVPTDFTQTMFSDGGQARLVVLQDPVATIGPSIVKNLLSQYLAGINGARVALQTASQQLQLKGVELTPEIQAQLAAQFSQWYQGMMTNLNHNTDPATNPMVIHSASSGEQQGGGNELEHIIALIMAGQLIFFAFFTGAFSTQSILREEEEWTLQRLFSTPTSRTQILGGKILAVFLMVIVQVTTLVVLSALAFRIHWGNPVSVMMVIVGLVMAAGGFGLLVMSWVKTTRQAGPVLGGLLTFCGMLGGLFTVAVPNLPKAFDVMSYFLPQGWALKGWKLVLEGALPGEVILPALVTATIGVVCFVLGTLIFRKRYV